MSQTWDPEALRGMRLGSCVIEQPLGVGGMGAVYLARQERPRRQVAIKVLTPQLAADPEAWRIFLARFRLEADATAALDHANIVPIYEFGEQDGIAYLVMPYLANGSVDSLLAHGPLAVSQTADYVAQAAAALDYAHAHGIIHRDVKPSNLLLHPDGRLMLADFGIARLTSGPVGDFRLPRSAKLSSADLALTQLGTAMGTPEYMAPEQVRGEPVGPSVDTYALGIVAYVMLSSRSPFAGSDMQDVLRRQINDPPYPLRALRDDIPQRVEEAIFWAMAKDPADRPESASAFAAALSRAARARTLSSLYERLSSRGEGHQAGVKQASQQLPVVAAPRFRGHTVEMHSAENETAHLVRPVAQGTAEGGLPAAGVPSVLHPDAPTLFDPGPSQTPSPDTFWPGAQAARPYQRRRSDSGKWLLGAFAAAVGVFVFASLVLVALAQNGNSLMSGFGLATATKTAAPTATPIPTATPTLVPTATATPLPANWLSVNTNSIDISCGGDRRTTIQLSNIGPQTVHWYSNTPSTGIFTQIRLSPTSGRIASGGQTTISITNYSLQSSEGDILFVPVESDAGNPVAVHYTANGCG